MYMGKGETVEQVRVKQAAPRQLRQIIARGRDNACVHLGWLAGGRQEGSAFNHMKQLFLNRYGQMINMVDHQCAIIGLENNAFDIIIAEKPRVLILYI